MADVKYRPYDRSPLTRHVFDLGVEMTSHPNGGEGVTRFVTNCDKEEGGVSSFVMSHESF